MVVVRWLWDKSAIYNKWVETGCGQGLKVSKIYLKFSYQCPWLHHVHNRSIGEFSPPRQQATRQRPLDLSLVCPPFFPSTPPSLSSTVHFCMASPFCLRACAYKVAAQSQTFQISLTCQNKIQGRYPFSIMTQNQDKINLSLQIIAVTDNSVKITLSLLQFYILLKFTGM